MHFRKKIKPYTLHRDHTRKYSRRNHKIYIKIKHLHAFRKPPHFHHQWSLFDIKQMGRPDTDRSPYSLYV